MITHIRTVGFKGFDLDEDVPEKIIYTGKNKSGKSTRAAAIAFTLLGHVPWATSGKLPSDILNSFGTDMITSEVTIYGTKLGRKLKRNADGKVSQSFQVNGKVASKDKFTAMLGKVGSPKIADTAEFMKQSEAKKVDTLFDLYPNPELQMIDTAISNAKEDVSRIEKKITGADSTIARLTASKSEIVMPSGTIASVQDEIKSIDSQISDLEKQIKEAEIEEAKRLAKEEADRIAKKEREEAAERAEIEKSAAVAEAKKQERERIESEKTKSVEIDLTRDDGFDIPEKPEWAKGDDHEEIPLKTEEDWTKYNLENMPDSPEMAEADRVITRMENQVQSFNVRPEMSDEEFFKKLDPTKETRESIQRIINALVGSGCSTCAALIVAKQELKKYV